MHVQGGQSNDLSILFMNLLKDDAYYPLPQEGVVPVEVFINLGSLPQLTGVPVVGEMVLANQIGHDRRAAVLN